MSDARVRSLAAVVGLIIFCGAFIALILPASKAPMPHYYPELREWRVESKSDPNHVAMNFYGRSLYAILLGGAAFLLTLAALKKWGKRLEAIEDLHLYASMILAIVLFVTCLIYALNDLGILQQQL